jgi:uncharacterized protein (DUF58 family)
MITGRVPLLVLVVGAVALPLTPSPWVGALVAVAVPLLLALADLAAAAPLGAVVLERAGDRAVWLDRTATVRLTVTNGGRGPLRARIRDAWVPSAGASPYEHRARIEPGASHTVDTSLRPVRRGDRRAVRVILRSYGPLGLAYRQRSRTPQWTLRVLPRFASRRFLPEKMARLRVLDGAVATRGRGQGTEFDALREYVVGDDIRSIDWRASARRSDVVVRNWRPERDRRVLCVLDTGRTSAVRVDDEPRLDTAIDGALLLATLAGRAGDRVDLLAIDNTVRAAVSGVRQHALISALAPLEPALVETDFGLVAGEVLRRERKRALVVLFTALEPAALGEGLLPVLSRLATRHRVVVAAVQDPTLARLATLPAEVTPAAVYAAAATHRALAERDRVQAALSRHGVEVVDAPAELFASRVADVYLRMKATGRL